MGTITLGLLDIGSMVAGYLFGKAAPKVLTAAQGGDATEAKAEAGKLITAIEAKLAEIKAQLSAL